MRKLLAIVSLAATGCHTTAPEPAPTRITLVCWNIHHGRGADRRVDLDRIANVLRRADPDVVALQEVDVGVARTARLDLPRELARRLGMQPLFGHNLDFQGGRYGNALLTRLKIERWHNHRFTMLRAGEQRGVLCATLRTAAGPLTVLVTHLDYRRDDRERLAHVRELRRIAASTTGPLVIAGDFNADPGSAVHRAALDWTHDAWRCVGTGAGNTYPADRPRKRIDWVLLPRVTPGVDVSSARVEVDRTASDHRPLRVQFVVRRSGHSR